MQQSFNNSTAFRRNYSQSSTISRKRNQQFGFNKDYEPSYKIYVSISPRVKKAVYTPTTPKMVRSQYEQYSSVFIKQSDCNGVFPSYIPSTLKNTHRQDEPYIPTLIKQSDEIFPSYTPDTRKITHRQDEPYVPIMIGTDCDEMDVVPPYVPSFQKINREYEPYVPTMIGESEDFPPYTPSAILKQSYDPIFGFSRFGRVKNCV